MRSGSTSRGRRNQLGFRAASRVLLLAICSAPLAILTVRGIAGSQSALLSHLWSTVYPMQLGYSLLSSTGAVLLGATLASGGALCGLFDFPGRRVLQRMLLVPLLVPPWFYAVLYQDQFSFSGLAALIVAFGVGSAPLFQLFITASLLDIPIQHLHVLQTTGHSSPTGLIGHLLPFALPALGAAAVLVFLLTWGDGSSARILAVPTLAVGVFDQWFGRQDEGAGATAALSSLVTSLVPMLLLWALVSRKSWAESARLQRGGMGRVRVDGPKALLPWVLSLPLLIIGVALPGLIIGGWTIEHIDRVALATLGQDILHTLLLALCGSLMAGLLALFLLRDRVVTELQLLTTVTSRIMLATFAIPPIVLALAFLWLLPEDHGCLLFSWLNATPIPLAFAMAWRFSAIFLVAGEAALLRSARAHADIVRVCGQTRLTSFTRLFRPFLAGPIMASACFIFLECLKDLSLSLVLQPFGFTTVAMRLFQYSQTQRVQEGAVWIVCLALAGAYPLSVLARLAESDRRTTLSKSAFD